MLIYLASPYSAPKGAGDFDAARIREERYNAAVDAVAVLMQAGVHVYSPIAACHPIALKHALSTDAAYWRAFNHAMIDSCGEVWVLELEGYGSSVGVNGEVEYAIAQGKRVRCVDPSGVLATVRELQPVAPPEIAARVAELGANPKDAIGATKVSLSKLPAVAVLHGAHAMMNGAVKYGAYNWRGHSVIASIYVDACLRHVNAWFDGEELAADSGVRHLGHAIACLSILLDAQATGNLIDDRPPGGKFSSEIERVNVAIKASAK
jgi:hypothetical protein